MAMAQGTVQSGASIVNLTPASSGNLVPDGAWSYPLAYPLAVEPPPGGIRSLSANAYGLPGTTVSLPPGGTSLAGTILSPLAQPFLEPPPGGHRVLPVDVYGAPGAVVGIPTAVPEPSTASLFVGGLLALIVAAKTKMWRR
jgi:hypothetical protein